MTAMRSLAPWLSLALLVWLPACEVSSGFACNADDQCVTDVAAGRCEAEGVCSFPDEACPSGRRFGALAGELSGECVVEGTGDGTTTGSGMTSSVAEGTLSPDGSGPSTTSSTSTTTSTTSTSTATSTSTTTGPQPETTSATSGGPDPEDDRYGPCKEDRDCVGTDPHCLSTPGGLKVCSPPCAGGSCTYDGMAMVTPSCSMPFMNETSCVLLCDAPDACPAGMECEDLFIAGVSVCGWP